MNKNDLIQHLSDRTGLAKHDAAKAVDGVFDVITDTLKAGDEVRLTGFGVFVVGRGSACSDDCHLEHRFYGLVRPVGAR